MPAAPYLEFDPTGQQAAPELGLSPFLSPTGFRSGPRLAL
jgi:hypothetical protein